MLMMQKEKEKDDDDDDKHEEFISLFAVYLTTLSVTVTVYVERFCDT
jgi:hypothetical protein